MTKTLFVRYTPIFTYIYFFKKGQKEQEAFFMQYFSSKEITKFLVPTIQNILQKQESSLDEVTQIAATVGPAPAFSLRSMLAAINGIKVARILENKELFLYAIDDFFLMHEWYKNKHSKDFVVSLYNAFSQELFYLYTINNTNHRGIWSEKTILSELQNLEQKNLIIIGSLSDSQKQFLQEANIPYMQDPESENDFFRKTIKTIDNLAAVPFLFPYYTKLHSVEKKL